LGSGGQYPNHSDYFTVDEECFKTGVAWYIQVAMDCLTDRLNLTHNLGGKFITSEAVTPF
ncbi:MAG: hypothetical protein LBT93_00165, partial [Treponema sp.]|nr:hypothetical protein [Treponema sp.]